MQLNYALSKNKLFLLKWRNRPYNFHTFCNSKLIIDYDLVMESWDGAKTTILKKRLISMGM